MILRAILIACMDPDRGQGFRTSLLENQKNIGVLSNTGPNRLENYKGTKPAMLLGHRRPA